MLSLVHLKLHTHIVDDTKDEFHLIDVLIYSTDPYFFNKFLRQDFENLIQIIVNREMSVSVKQLVHTC